MIDIIIPVLNEEKILTEKKEYYQNLARHAQVIFVDGGSGDRTMTIAREYGEVIRTEPGRAIQKNRGAQAAGKNYLLFLHVDSFISPQTIDHICNALQQGDVVGGCLTMRIDDAGAMFRFYEWAVNIRAKTLGVIDGDLGTFVRRDVFQRVNGFDELPVMEDLTFGKKLRAAGRINVLKDSISVSSRKWHERGFVRTFLDYTLAYLRLWTGRLNPHRHPEAKPKDLDKQDSSPPRSVAAQNDGTK